MFCFLNYKIIVYLHLKTSFIYGDLKCEKMLFQCLVRCVYNYVDNYLKHFFGWYSNTYYIC